MHEITLCQRALELIEQQAVQNHAKRVTGVWLKVGAFSCVETSALTFCFELVCRGTLAEGCELHIEEQQAESWCEQCQQYVTLVSSKVSAARSVRAPVCASWRMTACRSNASKSRRSKVCVVPAVAPKATCI